MQVERTADPSASLRVTKGRPILPCASVAGGVKQQVPLLRYAPGRDDNSNSVRDARAQENLSSEIQSQPLEMTKGRVVLPSAFDRGIPYSTQVFSMRQK